MNGRKYSDCSMCKYYGKRDNEFPCDGCWYGERNKRMTRPTLFVEIDSQLPPSVLSERLLRGYLKRRR
jgi:hypothetical protein